MIETRFHADHVGGRELLVVERIQDVEAIIENNKRLQGEDQSRTSDFRHIASIPNIFLEQWLNEETARGNTTIRLLSPEMDKLVERKLQDPEWKFLRVDNKSNPFHIGWR